MQEHRKGKIMEENEGNESDDSDEKEHDNSVLYSSVKSTAVVKYSAVDSPATFALLQCNTDLNLPPANWLSSSAESYGLQYVLSNSTGFSSFRMADMFPDCVGEVDLISDAENIKKLLKLPYSRGPVSMLVHRIKTTLLIDDFDIQKFLFRSPEVNWHSLRNFLLEQVFESRENQKQCLTDESKRRNVLQQENLASKFLYHSLKHLEKKEPEKLKYGDSRKDKFASDSNLPPLPEPNITEELPDTNSEHRFVRNVVWTFENIQMLLGTDMPIFGDCTHPCVSLRLRDMSKPINVLTGIDYWLDNLMCNVPEVAMCFHNGGIVQKYELIKTEDLPYMEDSKFSPKLIRDVAQNILAFLKRNATKAGHTYWLLKGKDDDVIKLYDLTSLCSSSMVDNSENPFTIPVALLLYRVARNMKHAPNEESPTNPGTIRMLLKNCIRLLPREKYPQIISSAHYMFSDSLIPLNTDPASPHLEDVYEKIFAKNNKKDINYECQEKDDDSDSVKTLCLSQKPMNYASSSKGNVFNDDEVEIMQSLEKRCKTALEHIADGLNCLKYFDEAERRSRKTSQKEEKLNMAHPSTPIPMPYGSIQKESVSVKSSFEKSEMPPVKKKNKKNAKKKEEICQSIGALLCKSHIETMPTWQNPPDACDNLAWKKHLKILLYEKACLVYATLAEYEYSIERYGNALKHIRLVLESRAHLTNGSCENILMSYLLGRAGDCCFQIGRKWNLVKKFKADFENIENCDAKMMAVMNEDVQSYEEVKFLPLKIESQDTVLNYSWMCYKKAIELEERATESDELQRRLGNICNELGSFYMKEARETQVEDEASKKKVEALFAVSMTHLENGINAFKKVNDEANLALLYSNTGRLMRLMAHFYSEDGIPLSKVAKGYYAKALSNYKSALSALSSKRLNPEIWDTISYELSTTLYTIATLLQDYPSQCFVMSKSELEREVVDYLSKALKYCDMETTGPRQPIYQYRAADIHHRLASLYHNTYRDLDKNSSKRSSILQLCLSHYEKAVKLFLTLELPSQFLRAQLEKIALYEFIFQNTNSTANKIKSLETALSLICQTAPILKIMCDRHISEAVESDRELISPKIDEIKSSDSKDNTAPIVSTVIPEDVVKANENKTVLETDDGKTSAAKNEDGGEEGAEEQRMLDLLESRFQFILLSLIKQCSSTSKYSSVIPKYKELYSNLLRSSKDKNISTEQRLYQIITQQLDLENE